MRQERPKIARKRGWSAVLLPAFLLIACGVFAQTPAAKVVGTVKSVNGNSVVLTTDSGADATVTFADSARIVRAIPGQTDLKNAAPIQVSDIQAGDRVAARGQSGEGGTLIASGAIVMKQGEIADVHQREREAWRRGIGGIVKEVNASAETITVANSLLASGKAIVVHVSSSTFKRYSPDSVKFDDAQPGTLDQIKPGDQLRARGTKSADGTEFTADAIVSGSFRDIAGTVVSTDAPGNSITITDLATKKPVTIKVGPDSQLRKLPQFVAMRIAMRLKGGDAAAAGANGAGGAGGGQGRGNGGYGGGRGGARQDAQSAGDQRGGMRSGGQGGNWRGNGGPPDFQQMLANMPAISISDLNKGDAVMLVATQGSQASQPTAITLLSGVEPILTAAPAGTSAATILSPWNLGEPGGAGGESAQ